LPLVVIAIDLVIGWRILVNSTFFADDFINMNAARQLGLGDGLFSRSVFGHFIPGFNYSNYVVALPRPWSWALVMTIVLGLYAGWLLLAERLLNALGTAPWTRSLILLVLGTSIITITDTPWWATSIEYHVLIVVLVAATFCHFRYVTTGRLTYATGAVLAVTVGMAFLEDAVVIPLFLLMLSTLVLNAGDDDSWRSRYRWAIEHWHLWTAYAVPVVFDVVWRLTHRATYAQFHPAPTTTAFLKFLWLFVVRTFVPLITGIYAWNLVNWQQIAVEIVTPLLWLGILAFLYSRGVAIGRLLLLTFVPLLVTGVLVGITRVQLLGVGSTAGDPKYVTLPYVMALLAGVCGWRSRDRTRHHTPVTSWLRVSALSLVAASVVVSLLQLPPLLAGTDSAKHYVTTFIQRWTAIRAKQPHAFLWNETVGVELIPTIFYPYNTVKNTLANEFANVSVDTDQGPGYVLSSTGLPVRAAPTVVATGPSHEICALGDNPTDSITVPLSRTVTPFTSFAIVTYTSRRIVTSQAPIGLSSTNGRSFYGTRTHRVVLDASSLTATTATIAVPVDVVVCVTKLVVIQPTPTS